MDYSEDVFQFTPLREGRHRAYRDARMAGIFQFTPLREGRLVVAFHQQIGFISIHAPTRGATHIGFQHLRGVILISIHAPTRGATVSEFLCTDCH